MNKAAYLLGKIIGLAKVSQAGVLEQDDPQLFHNVDVADQKNIASLKKRQAESYRQRQVTGPWYQQIAQQGITPVNMDEWRVKQQKEEAPSVQQEPEATVKPPTETSL